MGTNSPGGFFGKKKGAQDSGSAKIKKRGERKVEMTKQEVFQEIEQTFGLVPSMFKEVPDSMLELEWKLFREIQLEEGPIPQKYRELIGLAISGATKCQYCTYYHTEVARLFGATDEEIEAAAHYAKSTTGWSAYINSLQVDYDQFCSEVKQACEHIRNSQKLGETMAGTEVRTGVH
jgi:AhpD family alkylhydroperoxidase